MASLVNLLYLLPLLVLGAKAQTDFFRTTYRVSTFRGNGQVDGEIRTAGCGSLKGCYRDRTGCSPAKFCESIGTWRRVDNEIDFELGGSTTGEGYYIAMGFNKDRKDLPGSTQYECVRYSRYSRPQVRVSVYDTNGIPRYLTDDFTNALITVTDTNTDGSYMYCKYRLKLTQGSGGVIRLRDDFDRYPPVYIMLSKGPISGDEKGAKVRESVTENRISLSDYVADKATHSSGYLLLSVVMALLASLLM